jgi:hypothetical protein
MLDARANQSFTVKYSVDPDITEPSFEEATDWPLVATWPRDSGGQGHYVLESAYAAEPVFAGLTEVLDDGTARTLFRADHMATLVEDNTGIQTDFFGTLATL